MKKLTIFLRKTLKIFSLFLVAILVIILVLFTTYRPTYAVYYQGDMIGYTDDKKQMQKEFNEYVNLASEEEYYIELLSLPEYKMTFLKKTEEIDDTNIVDDIKNQYVTYYRYYAIMQNYQDMVYIDTFSNAENVINSLREKESQNIDELSIEERYDEEKKELTSVEDAINQLFVEPPKSELEINAEQIVAQNKKVSTSNSLGSGAPDIGITLIRPVNGVISSVFGHVSSLRSGAHTGLDIATSLGTPYMAAADGVVTYVGYNNAYGKMLVITHTSGVQTYYCHSNAIYVNVGDVVEQGQYVGEVGNTGNSTRPHLHLEVRINGVPYNPQYYVYN